MTDNDSYLLSLKHSLWNVLAGTRGGVTRICILKLLRKRPYNINQLHEKLKLDYKTIQHHIRVLTNNKIITVENEKKYGSMYFISPFLEKHMYLFDEILGKIGKRELNNNENSIV
ncbi:MAG: winged helix-turn-helix domain-containing protein [Candidatus Aenigmatarchaeota archaeon]